MYLNSSSPPGAKSRAIRTSFAPAFRNIWRARIALSISTDLCLQFSDVIPLLPNDVFVSFEALKHLGYVVHDNCIRCAHGLVWITIRHLVVTSLSNKLDSACVSCSDLFCCCTHRLDLL